MGRKSKSVPDNPTGAGSQVPKPHMECPRCGYIWDAKTLNPKECVKCHYPLTGRPKPPKPQYKCLRCGKSWPPKVPNPVQCPRCHNPHWRTPKPDISAA